MSIIKNKFQELVVSKIGQISYQKYDTAGGEVVLTKDGKLCVVWTDGRYPTAEQGFSVNQFCVEKITILFGSLVLETSAGLQTFIENQSFVINPKTPYSLAGKCVCKVEITTPDGGGWDSSQNSFVQI